MGGSKAVEGLCQALLNKGDSALFRHEVAYVLGQMRDSEACAVLEGVLADTADDSMVRHEAAEALGAIGSKASVEALQQFLSDPAPEVSQTCELALGLIHWRGQQDEDELDHNPYLSVDPSPSASKLISTAELQEQLLDESLPLFERYRAMFSLRNRGSEDDVLALGRALRECQGALLKHEVAYVLGQVQHVASVPALAESLQDEGEHHMVRHEAAEALGAIGGALAEELLKTHQQDSEAVVKESCVVALDTMDYWSQASFNEDRVH
ncbi:unnamed protein product [Chrysoparadoxa australica]